MLSTLVAVFFVANANDELESVFDLSEEEDYFEDAYLAHERTDAAPDRPWAARRPHRPRVPSWPQSDLSPSWPPRTPAPRPPSWPFWGGRRLSEEDLEEIDIPEPSNGIARRLDASTNMNDVNLLADPGDGEDFLGWRGLPDIFDWESPFWSDPFWGNARAKALFKKHKDKIKEPLDDLFELLELDGDLDLTKLMPKPMDLMPERIKKKIGAKADVIEGKILSELVDDDFEDGQPWGAHPRTPMRDSAHPWRAPAPRTPHRPHNSWPPSNPAPSNPAPSNPWPDHLFPGSSWARGPGSSWARGGRRLDVDSAEAKVEKIKEVIVKAEGEEMKAEILSNQKLLQRIGVNGKADPLFELGVATGVQAGLGDLGGLVSEGRDLAAVEGLVVKELAKDKKFLAENDLMEDDVFAEDFLGGFGLGFGTASFSSFGGLGGSLGSGGVRSSGRSQSSYWAGGHGPGGSWSDSGGHQDSWDSFSGPGGSSNPAGGILNALGNAVGSFLNNIG